MTDSRRDLLDIFSAALQAVDGRTCVRNYLNVNALDGPVYVVAAGKAACAMVRGAVDVLGRNIQNAFVVTKHGYAEPLPWPVREAGHPVPDEQSLAAGEALLSFVDALPAGARVLALWSGGASALLEALPPGLDLAQWQRINNWLLGSGLDIVEINRVRKRLSRIKGGRLAARLAPREIICLAISDVPGDDPRVIGSGPFVADESLPQTSLLPEFIRTAFDPVSPRSHDDSFERVRFHVVANLATAKAGAAQAARRKGYDVHVADEFIGDDAATAGRRLAQIVRTAPANALQVWGGETTVKLPAHPGRGGRNQSLALAAAMTLAGMQDVYFLSGGTDGSDGPTQEAGALVDGGTIERGTSAGLNAHDALVRADAGTFLEASGDLIGTGPTGTNVMDLMLGLRR